MPALIPQGCGGHHPQGHPWWLWWGSFDGCMEQLPSLLLMELLLPGSRAGHHLAGGDTSHVTLAAAALDDLMSSSLAYWSFYCSSSNSRPSTSPMLLTGPRSSCHHIPRVCSHRASLQSLAAAQGCWRSEPWGARHTSLSRMRRTIMTWTTEVREGGWVGVVPRDFSLVWSPWCIP